MNLNMTTATRYGLNVLALLGLSVAFYLGSSIFIPLTISALLATILYPAARRLNLYLKLPWFFACLTSVLILVAVNLAVVAALAASIPQLFNKLPTDRDGWNKRYTETAHKLAAVSPFPIHEILPEDPDNSSFYLSVTKLFSPENLSAYLQSIGSYGFVQLSQLLLILFITLFLLLEGEMLARKARVVFGPSTDTQGRVARALAEIADAVQTYLVWRTIVNAGLAIVLGLFYKYVFGLEQWYLWAVLAGVFSYVPYLGTIAAGLLPVLEALISGRPEVALAVIIFYTVIVTVEGYLIVPWVMGRSMDLNATTVMLACLYWHLVWGTAGLFLAMPLMAAIKAVCLHVEDWNAWGQLMSSSHDVEPVPADAVKLPDPDPTAIIEALAGPKARTQG